MKELNGLAYLSLEHLIVLPQAAIRRCRRTRPRTMESTAGELIRMVILYNIVNA